MITIKNSKNSFFRKMLFLKTLNDVKKIFKNVHMFKTVKRNDIHCK